MKVTQKLVFIVLSLCMGSTVVAQQSVPNLPWVDLSQQKERQIIIAEGTEKQYHGHCTTVLLDDNKTMFCTWSHDHGGRNGFLSVSKDAGLTWHKLETPKDWATTSNCPSIYNLKDKKGNERLFIFSAHPNMTQTYSEDLGKTWTPIKSLNKPCVMAFSSIVKLENGDYLGLYHRGFEDKDRAPHTLWQSISTDGGVTWGESVKVGEKQAHSPCEPFVFRAPNGKELACVLRENNRIDRSLMMFSQDEGQSWSDLEYTPWGLSGDRHILRQLPDGRLVAVFRDMAPNSPTKGHFVAWVGTYKDLKEKSSGQYKVKLLHSYAGSDCGYPGLELLPDGTLVATTYIKKAPGKEQHSIVSVRFKLEETDKMISQQ